MKVIENWKAALLHADSMIGVILLWITALGPVLAVTFWRDTNPLTWIAWALVMPPFVMFLRVRDQGIARGQPRRRWPATLAKYAVVLVVMLGSVIWTSRVEAAPATEAETFKIALPLVKKWEGRRLSAYLDPIGIPTICDGATRVNNQPVRMGMTMTHAQCDALLLHDLRTHRNGLHAYWTSETIARRLPPTRDAAFTSFAFNVGVAGAGKSTAARRLNAGNIAGACQAIGWWNKAGGRVLRGLVNRRADETGLCLVGLT